MADLKFDTIKVRGGYNAKEHNNSVGVPVYATASFEVNGAEQFDRLRSATEIGYLYTRIGNPTNAVLEQRVAQLDGGVAAVAVASGMAAITYTLLAITAGAGRIITTHQLYGGTLDAIQTLYTDFGISVDKLDNNSSADDFEEVITIDTKAIFVESISNPDGILIDIEALAEIAHKNSIPLIVDNTFATPYLFNPIKHGADIVIYSATKALNGHGNAIGGVIVEAGNFNWGNGKFPQFQKKHHVLRDLNNNQRSFLEVFPLYPFSAKIRLNYLAYLGAVLSPYDAQLILIGIETLSERVSKQVSNTEKIVDFLKNNKHVEWIKYPWLDESPYKILANKYFPKGTGSVFTFGFKGNDEQIYKLTNTVKLFSYQANVGDARSLIINSPKTTHGELNAEQQKDAGIQPNTIRLSIGLEDADDLINDLEQAFEAALV